MNKFMFGWFMCNFVNRLFEEIPPIIDRIHAEKMKKKPENNFGFTYVSKKKKYSEEIEK